MQEEPTQAPVSSEPVVEAAAPIETPTFPRAFSLIKESIEYYKQHFATLIGLAGIYTGVSYGFVFLGIAVFLISGITLFGNGMGIGTEMGVSIIVGGTLLLLLLLVAAVWFITWTMIALMKNILSKDVPLSVHESFTQAKPLIWPFLITSFWSGLASFGVVAVALLLIMVLVTPLIILGNPILLVIGLVAGLLFLLVSMFVANTWFLFAQWLVIEGKAQGREAVARSKELTKGIFNAVLWRYLVISFAYAIPVMVISLICEIAIPIVGSYISQAISILMFFPILLIVMARFYQALIAKQAALPTAEKVSTRDVTILSVIGVVSMFLFVFASVFAIMNLGPELMKEFDAGMEKTYGDEIQREQGMPSIESGEPVESVDEEI